jgi:D-alanyl-D-alanine carboxypeptidase
MTPRRTLFSRIIRVKIVSALLLLSFLNTSGAIATASSITSGKVIDNFIASLYPASEPGAVVVVAKEGETLLRKGYGVSALWSAVPMEPATPFRVGSISKQFTAVGILLLVEARVIYLSDPVTRFFPEFPRFLSSVRVEHLLAHTSGLRNYSSLPQFRSGGAEFPQVSILQAIRDSPLSFNPGEAWEYSDSNYFLLGAIIERATGLPYCGFMEDRIFRRLGMTQTRCASFGDQCDLIPVGYLKYGRDFVQITDHHPSVLFSAGSILSNVDDILRWYRALKSGELLRRDLSARAFQGFKLRSGELTLYGFGWVVHDIDGIRVIEHGGMVDGFESHILWMPDEDIFVAVLSNSRGRTPTPDVLATRIAFYLSSHHLPLADTLLNPTELGPIAGIYRTDDRTYEIGLHDGHVLFSREDGSRARLIQLFDGRFLLENTFTLIVIQADRVGGGGTLRMKTKYGKEKIAVFDPSSAKHQ